jgi:CRP/FNR family transcriptional activator FtrB
MRESDRHLIRGFPLFRGVPDVVFESVMRDAVITDVDPPRRLLTEGELPQTLFVLLNGLVEAYTETGGRATTLAFIRPPSAFIVAAVWLNQPQLTSVKALARSRILAIPAADVQAALATDRAFCAALGDELAIRYRDIMKELKNQRTRSATERLANWLLAESRVAGAPGFELPVGRSTLAARLGISPEHLSRAFAQLREHGVESDGRLARIDREVLARFARPDPLIDGSDV